MNGGLMTAPELEPHLPVPGFSVEQPLVKTGDWTDEFRKSIRGTIRSAPIWRVRKEQRYFRLSQAILVRVRHDEGFFFAENETLQLVGTGSDVEAALADFSMHLVHFHQYYSSLPEDRVIGEGKRLRNLFRDLFVEE